MNFKFYLTITSLFIVLSYNAFSQLNADFSTYTPTNGCSPLNVTFKDQSTGSIISRKWIFGNGNSTSSGNQTSPSAVYGDPNTYTVTLIISDGTNFDTIIKTNYITVYNDPVANFSNTTALSGCNPLNVGFQDNSTGQDGAITYWSWDFGDGYNATEQDPAHTYLDFGSFPVSLYVIDEHGCYDTKLIENYVNVSQSPEPDFVANDTNQCVVPFDVTFTNLSTSAGNLTYSWNFGDGNISTLEDPSNTFINFGLYDVSLFASDENGCSSTIVKNDYITILDASADFNTLKTFYCIDEEITFNNTSIGCTQYLWDFGDGVTDTAKNPIHSFNTWGDYTITLTSSVENGTCSDVITKTINVERIVAAFSVSPSRACEVPVTVNYTDESINAVSWSWNGTLLTSYIKNPILTYLGQGVFKDTLIVTSQHGCKDMLIVDSNVVISIPSARIYGAFTSGCSPVISNFVDVSFYDSNFDSIVSRLWEFDDGFTSTQDTLSHVFNVVGIHPVFLTINTAMGCAYKDSTIISVGSLQNPDFIVEKDSSCASDRVKFFDNSTDSSLINYWSWIFVEDTIEGYTRNPEILFTDTGYFNLTYTIGFNGCDTTIYRDSVVYIQGPVGNFTNTFDCSSPLDYIFTSNIIDADKWVWDFNDGVKDSVQQNLNHTFTSGDYRIRLNLSNSLTNCFYVDSSHYIRARNLIADFDVDTAYGCPGLTVNFNPDSTQDEVNFGYSNYYRKYLWNYDDNSKFYLEQLPYEFTTTSVTHTFANKGIYRTSLIVEDINGCRDTTYKNIKVYKPVPDFSTAFESGCKPFNVDFTNLTPADTTMSAWHWNFGNGDTSNIQNPTTTYNEYGIYDVMLSATNILGCTSYITKPGFISVQTASPSFTVIDSTLCMNDSTIFINTTPGDSLSYLWDFGNGVTSTEINPIYFYPDTGNYDVSLKVIDTVGCDTTFIKYSYIKKQKFPVADFIADTLNADCYPLIVSFDDNSGTQYSSVWNWNFGDEATSTLQNPIHAFSRPGQFDVTLEVSTSFGCKDSITKENFVVVKGPYADFSFINPVVCKETPIAFYIDTLLDVDLFSWDFGDGVVVPGTGDTVYHTYSDYGLLYPQLIYSDSANSCPKFERDSIIINLVTSDFSISDLVLCSGSSLTFVNNSMGGNSYEWDFGDANNSYQPEPIHSYSTPGNYTVYLTVFDEYSCTAVDSMPVTINPLPNYLAINDTIKCDYDTISLDAGIGFTSYLWSDNSTTQTLDVASQGLITVKVKNAEGCWSAKDSIFVTDIPTPEVDFGADKLICEGTATFLQPAWSQFHTYLWNDSTTNGWHFAFPLNTYSVTITNECGRDSDEVYIDMIPLPTVNLGVDTAICNGTSLTLFATGSQYDTYEWDDGSTADSLIADTIKTYSVTVSNSCNSANDSKTIDLIPIPDVTFVDDTLCEGTTITIFAPFSIYHNYLWNTGDTIDSITAFPDSLYSVTVSNVCDTSSASIFIEKIPLPVVNLGVDTAICNGTSLTLFATGSQYDSYLWNDNSTLDSLIADTIYTYSVTVSNVCDTANGSKTIDLIPIPNVTFVDDTLCEETTITVFAPFSIYHNYLWNTGDTIDSITAFPDSLYSVTVTNVCDTSTASIFIEKIPLPVVNLGVDTAICTGTSLTLFATGSQYDSYLWNDGSTLDSLVADTIYTYSVTISNVCDTANGSKAIDLIPIPNVTFVDDTLCEGTTITVFAPFSIYHNYLWNTGDTIDSITAFPDSLYSVTVTNVCDTSSASIFIEKIPLPIVNLGIDTAICTGTSLTLFATGSEYDSYLWNDGSTADSLIADTIYTYSVTVSNVCDTASGSKTIDLIPIPNVTFVDDTLCEGTTITVFAPFSIYHNYLWNTGAQIDSITAFPDSLYSVTVTNVCDTSSASIFIEKIPLPVVNLGVDTAICNGTSLTLFATGSQYDSYLWNDGSTLDSLVADTIYTYSVTISNVCDTANGSKAIDLIPIPNVSFVDDTLCEGTTITVFAPFSIYHNYLWNTGDTIDSITAFPDSLYSVTVTNVCDTSTASIFIEKIPLPVVNLGVDTAICNGTNLTLFATGSQYDSYLWNDGSTLDSLIADTIYTYSVTVSNVCDTANGSKTIDLIPIPDVTFVDDTLCEGTTITVFAPFSIYHNYLWNTGVTIDSITAFPDSLYSVTVTNVCDTSSASIFIEKIPLPVVNLGVDTAICNGTSLMLFATGSEYDSYLWNDNSTLDSLVADTIKTYFVKVSNSCAEANDSISIDLIPIPNVFLGNDTLICEGTTLTLDAGTSIYYTYLWNNDSITQTQIADTISYFAVTLTNDCGVSKDSINIGLKPNPVISFGVDTTFCENSNITIDWITGYIDYYWSDSSSLQNLTISVSDTVSLQVRDSVGCFSNIDTIAVKAVSPPLIDFGNDKSICIGDSILLSADSSYDSYLWNNGSTNDSLYISQTGTYYLEVRNACDTTSDTLNLFVYAEVIKLGLDTILCPLDTLVLDAGIGFTSYKWSDGATNQTITVNSTGAYSVSVTNSILCNVVSDTVDVFYLPNSVNLGNDTAICEGNIISFSTPDNFDTLTWHNGFNYPVFTTSKHGTYYLTAENKCGTFSDTIILAVKPIPSVELGPDIAVSFETETLDAGDDATTYLWSTGDTSRTILVTPGNYAVWVEVDKDGCKASDTIRILYSPYDSGCIFGVPNAFTPNGDNKNDVLHVRGYCIEEVEFMVFNRFGEMVFKSEDINTGWDGKYKGRLQESEVYIWYLKVKLTDGQTVEKTGNVALLN